MRLAGALQRFWIVRGHLAEGRRRLERLLALDIGPTAARGKALNGAALLALNTGAPGTARRLAAEALALHDSLGDRWGAARSAFALGFAHADERDFVVARDLLERSLAGFAALGDEHNVLFVAVNLAGLYRELGEPARARQLDETNLRRARELGNESMVALSLAGLAMAALDDGRGDEALAMLREALAIDRTLSDLRRTVDDLCRLCRALAATGQSALAVRLLAGAESLHAEIGASVSPEIERLNAGTRDLIRDTIGQAALDEAAATGPGMTFDDAYALARG
jgi:non-specific serine/threonine protein kinase